jgi:hypothetical protein
VCGSKDVHGHIMWILGKKALWSFVFVFCCAALSHKFIYASLMGFFFLHIFMFS